MSLFFLSNAALDIIAGITWWTVHKTYNGIHYVIYGNSIETDNKKLLNELIKKTETQQIEIKQLSTHISVLSDYIKNQNQLIE